MPNWCHCELSMEGPSDVVQEAASFMKTEGPEGPQAFDFNKLVPYPEEFALKDRERDAWIEKNPESGWADAPPDGYNHGGCEWCRENWGTKWNACGAVLVDVIPSEIAWAAWTFDTAWTPPCPVVLALARRFPGTRVCLKFSEEGVGFHGTLICKNGKVVVYEAL